MGCDYSTITFDCPICKDEEGISYQSGGEFMESWFPAKDDGVPQDVAAMILGDECKCYECGQYFIVVGRVPPEPPYVKMRLVPSNRQDKEL